MGWNYFSIPNFNGTTVKVCEWISNFIPHFTALVITYPCCLTMLVKGVSGCCWQVYFNTLGSRCYLCNLVWLHWRHNGHDSVSNHQPHDCLLNRLCRRRSKKTSKLRVTGLCAGNSPRTGEFPAQMASNAENVSIWWRHYVRMAASWRSIYGHGVFTGNRLVVYIWQ